MATIPLIRAWQWVMISKSRVLLLIGADGLFFPVVAGELGA